MEFQFWFIIGALALGLYMSWNIGANDVANSMASAVGAKAITFKQAVLIAAILSVIGAVFIGSHVTQTVSKGIIVPTRIGDPKLIVIGFFSALLAAGIWVTLATWMSMPISTTHSIIGALIGFGLVAGGGNVVNWSKLGAVAASWIISPVFAGLIAYLIFHLIAKFILRKHDPNLAARKFSPIFVGATFLIITLSLLLKTRLGTYTRGRIVEISVIVTAISALIGYFLTTKATRRGADVEAIFRKLQIMTSCYVALSHGANDVANAAGPIVSILYVVKSGIIPMQVHVPAWVLIVGGAGIAVGIMTWGYRVMRTVAWRITELTNTRGFTIDFSAATSILIASKLGMPVSTTHAVIGAVVGVGLARGLEAVNLSIVRKIVMSWLITVPVAALTTIPIYLGLLHIWR